ncbi:MAG: hypothetical protein EOM19_04975, partial [Candidatus Moranbacteria bacterium]|nr:hypothetical protein [Candidatus Moranbacteria bacterium]
MKSSFFFSSLLLVSLFGIFLSLPLSTQAGELELNPAWEYVPNGAVRTMIPDGEGNVYLGGDFTQIGPYSGGGIKINTITNQIDTTFPKVNGIVRVSLPDGVGGWYIGGSFTQVGDINRNNIAHILSD